MFEKVKHYTFVILCTIIGGFFFILGRRTGSGNTIKKRVDSHNKRVRQGIDTDRGIAEDRESANREREAGNSRRVAANSEREIRNREREQTNNTRQGIINSTRGAVSRIIKTSKGTEREESNK